jgi:(+)-trans-carveol dehydrogenase
MTGPGRGQGRLHHGSGSGQGRAHALRLAEEGADIIGIDICEQMPGVEYPLATQDDLKRTVAEVEARDRRMVAAKADGHGPLGVRYKVSWARGSE